jgi:transposase
VQARALLWAADGVANEEIARRSGVGSDAVRRWRSRFSEAGVAGVGRVAQGRGRKPSLPPGTVEQALHATAHDTRPGGATHWTTRTMAARIGIGKDSVARIWADHGLKPWKVDTFNISNDRGGPSPRSCDAPRRMRQRMLTHQLGRGVAGRARPWTLRRPPGTGLGLPAAPGPLGHVEAGAEPRSRHARLDADHLEFLEGPSRPSADFFRTRISTAASPRAWVSSATSASSCSSATRDRSGRP